jgi:hypothetical protein
MADNSGGFDAQTNRLYECFLFINNFKWNDTKKSLIFSMRHVSPTLDGCGNTISY